MLLIVVLKTMALRTGDEHHGDEHHNAAARFLGQDLRDQLRHRWVTGIMMEFQLATNCSRFWRAPSGVFEQTLTLEEVYSFFLESTFLGLFLFGKALGRIGHSAAAVGVVLR